MLVAVVNGKKHVPLNTHCLQMTYPTYGMKEASVSGSNDQLM